MPEVNIDCLAGPTHHFGGLAFGNKASELHKGNISHPKKAAIQGLEKMNLVSSLGATQIVLPPHQRPLYSALRSLGFTGSEQEMIKEAYDHALSLLLMASSSSAMWTANSATVAASADTYDHKVHITPANLASNFHRSLEVPYTSKILQAIFHDRRYFVHHAPLPYASEFFDEGAANHTRFYLKDGPGLHFFVYGKNLQSKSKSEKYPARQSLEAQQALCRRYGLKYTYFAEQNPKAIDAGVFHNDVISTGNDLLFFYHEEAFVDTPRVISELQGKAEKLFSRPLTLIEIKRSELTLDEAVKSYLFNSQIICSSNTTYLLCPEECKDITIPKIFTPIFVPLRESMKNGGGPACLRLRMWLTHEELQSVHKPALFTPELYTQLKAAIENLYPDTFSITDLLDSDFRRRCAEAQRAICTILQLESA